MAKQTINIGAAANDGTGDPIRTAFGKVNDNFTEIYTANTGVNTGDQNLSAYATTAAVAAGYQPLDSDLTAIAALTTTAYGRALLSTADAPTLRTAIGLGQTDAPTFLAQSLTGQSLTGTQATSLLDLATTWDTTGTPTGIKLNATNTNSNPAALLMDLQVTGVSAVKVTKNGLISISDAFSSGGFVFRSGNSAGGGIGSLSGNIGVWAGSGGAIGFSTGAPLGGAIQVSLYTDAAGILAQRNGTVKQTLRIYNTYTSASIYERAVMDWNGPTPGNLQIGTEFLGSGSGMAARPIDFVTGGVVRMSIAAAGAVTVASDLTLSGTFSLRVGGILQAGANQGIQWGTTRSVMASSGDGLIEFYNSAINGFNRLNLGGTTNSEPAIARDGAGIKFTGAAAGSTSWIKVPAVAVSALPSASTAGVGARSFVNDALTPVFGSAVVGLGSVTVPVYSTGSAWNVG